MITIGVDLASHANDTAIAVIDWSEGYSKALRVVLGADDEMIVDFPLPTATARANTYSALLTLAPAVSSRLKAGMASPILT